MGYDVGILHDLVGVGAHDDPAIPWFRLKFKLFYYPGGRTHGSGAAKQTLSCGILPAECLASQKAGHFPCGKSLVLPRAPADISAQRKFVIWLANKVRETNLFSSFGYGENLQLWASSDAKHR